jgi:cell wall-associated NlpC family hydrolase
MIADLSDYVGLPFKNRGRTRGGIDCWGLFRLVQSEVFGIEQPSYEDSYVSVREKEVVNTLISGSKELTEEWSQIPQEAARVGDCILLFRWGEYHLGVVAYPGKFLHVEINGSLIEDYTTSKYRSQIAGFYRYVGPHRRATAEYEH